MHAKVVQGLFEKLKKVNADIVRDGTVIGVRDDNTRLLAGGQEPGLWMDAVRIGRGKEASKHAGDGMPLPVGLSAHVSGNAVQRQACAGLAEATDKRQKQTIIYYQLIFNPDLLMYIRRLEWLVIMYFRLSKNQKKIDCTYMALLDRGGL